MSRRIGGRLGWGVADQAFSSITNFALALVAARTVAPAGFGAFSLVFASYTVVLGIARAVATEPLAVTHSGAAPAELRRATSAAAGASLTVAVAGSAAAALAALVVEGPLQNGLWALVVVLPGVVVQDAWRLAFFVADRGASALVNDVVWAALLAAGLVAVTGGSATPSAATLLLVWGCAGTAAAIVGAFQARSSPAAGRAVAWLRATGGLSSRYVPEFVTTVAGAQLTLFAVGAVTDLAETGALRGAQVVLGPLNVLFMGAALVAVPEAVRALSTSRARLVSLARAIAALLGGAALVWGLVVLALPDAAGAALLGDTWPRAEPVVLPLTLWSALLGVIAGPMTALRALGAAGTGLRVRAVVAAASVAASLVGAVVSGAEGAAWGLAAAAAGGAVLWWRALGRTHEGAGPLAPAVPAPPAAGGEPPG